MGRLCYNMAGKTAKGRNEKMIRLVTCDIDGTLLHGEETSIDAETLEEIRRLREKGITFLPGQRPTVPQPAAAVCPGAG